MQREVLEDNTTTHLAAIKQIHVKYVKITITTIRLIEGRIHLVIQAMAILLQPIVLDERHQAHHDHRAADQVRGAVDRVQERARPEEDKIQSHNLVKIISTIDNLILTT